MGLYLIGSRSSYDNEPYVAPKQPNPDPKKYTIENANIVNGHLLLKIRYDGCTNYEGKKVLVYAPGVTLQQLKDLPGGIDPHFSGGNVPHPIARFRPDNEGWVQAHTFCKALG